MLQIIRSRVKRFSLAVDEDIDGVPLKSESGGGFIPSKWETVDPEQIEAQAITTSKWDTLDPVAPEPPAISTMSDDSFDSFENNRDFDEEKRNRLREIELKTIQYQDELESGQRNLKSGWTVLQQIEHYRRKLMKKTLRELQDSPGSSLGRDTKSQTSAKRSPSPLDSARKAKKAKRSPSPAFVRSSRHKSRDSLSPPRDSRSSRREKNRSRSKSRSRSFSLSPKRYETSPPRRHRQDSLILPSERSHTYASLSFRRSPTSSQRSVEGGKGVRSTKDASPLSSRYPAASSSASRHRADKHRHKHKY